MNQAQVDYKVIQPWEYLRESQNAPYLWSYLKLTTEGISYVHCVPSPILPVSLGSRDGRGLIKCDQKGLWEFTQRNCKDVFLPVSTVSVSEKSSVLVD